MLDARKKVLIEVNLDDKASAGLQKLQGTTQTSATSMATSFGKVAAIATAAIVTAKKMYSTISQGMDVAGQLETATQGFKALLGSAEEASAVVERIKKEAKATPFEIIGLTQGVQALTAITKDGQKATDILLNVGKAVALSGKGQAELDRVVYNLQQISATGTVTAMDLRQFQSAIPVFNDILALSGLTVEELQNSENAAELLFDAFEKFGTEGKGANAFTEQAGTWAQLISNVKDAWAIFTADFVTKTGIFDFLKGVVEKLTGFLVDDLTPAIVGVRDWFVNTWILIREKYDEYIKPFVDELWRIVKKYIIPAWDELKDKFKELFAKFSEDGNVTMDVLKNIAILIGVVVLGIVVGLIGALWLVIKVVGFVVDAVVWLKTKSIESWDKMIDRLAKIINFFRDIVWWVQKTIDKIKEIPSKIGIDFNGDKRATGGVGRGGMTLVGEAGPELVNLPRGSHVYNNKDSQQMVGGGGITINIQAPVYGVDNLKASIMEAVNQATEKQNRLANYNLL